jgi:hypothetical protein
MRHARRHDAVPCSSLTLSLALNDAGHHDEADSATMFWVRRTALANQWLDFAYKRLEFTYYPEIKLNTVRIRYMGELDVPTIQSFAAP